MIFFCEDCGTRNSLKQECINQGIVAFRCKSCNYLNSYPLPGTTRKSGTDRTRSDVSDISEKETGENNDL
ncbi:MAG: hypothetical protein HQK61_01680 [Desulfamplus sp.]|nr:hypothetical protein [Desulfamplus sp.]